MEKISLNSVTNMEFFFEVPAATLQVILDNAKEETCPKKGHVFSSGMVLQNVYILLEGKVAIYNMTRQGNRKIIFILGAGKLLNYNLISDKPSSVFCEALDDLRLLVINRKTFMECMERDYLLTKAVMREYEVYLLRMTHQLKNTTGNLYIERKLAAKLWKLGRDFGVPVAEGIEIDFDMTVNLLADLIGVPRENVSRACKTLKERQLIAYGNKRFIILNSLKLAEFYKT